MQLVDIYFGARRLINELLITEFRLQGHSHTGAWERSLDGEIKGNTLIGKALDYGKILNEGIEPEKISDRMLPGLFRYFQQKGLGITEATKAARFTLNKWKEEGMSTQASKRFSETGARQHFIEATFLNPEIDQFMTNLFDFAIDEKYNKVKSETI